MFVMYGIDHDLRLSDLSFAGDRSETLPGSGVFNPDLTDTDRHGLGGASSQIDFDGEHSTSAGEVVEILECREPLAITDF